MTAVIPDKRFLLTMPDEHVYLTFDDGPQPETTPAILDLLREFKVTATFFLIGNRAEKHPEIVKRIQSEGHTVGNHSYNHPMLLGKSEAFALAEIEKTDAILEDIIGSRPALFRPPYGKFGISLYQTVQKTGHKLILWRASTKDYSEKATLDSISERLRENARPGWIVLLHDGHQNSHKTIAALQKTLPLLIENGVKFKGLPE